MMHSLADLLVATVQSENIPKRAPRRVTYAARALILQGKPVLPFVLAVQSGSSLVILPQQRHSIAMNRSVSSVNRAKPLPRLDQERAQTAAQASTWRRRVLRLAPAVRPAS